MIYVVCDPVSETGVLFVKAHDRADDGTITLLCEKAIIGCTTKERAREVLVRMFGDGDGWVDGRFSIEAGTPEMMDTLVKNTGVSDVWDGEKLSKWRT